MRDAESFDEFYRASTVRLMRYALAVTGDLPDAQDLMQEAYTRAWRHWTIVGGHPNPEAWLRRTLGNLAKDRWRRLGRWPGVLRRVNPPHAVDPPTEDAVYVLQGLRRLPHRQRQALALHYLFDLPVAEIAAEIEVPVGSVKAWLARGRASLATLLADPREGDR